MGWVLSWNSTLYMMSVEDKICLAVCHTPFGILGSLTCFLRTHWSVDDKALTHQSVHPRAYCSLVSFHHRHRLLSAASITTDEDLGTRVQEKLSLRYITLNTTLECLNRLQNIAVKHSQKKLNRVNPKRKQTTHTHTHTHSHPHPIPPLHGGVKLKDKKVSCNFFTLWPRRLLLLQLVNLCTLESVMPGSIALSVDKQLTTPLPLPHPPPFLKGHRMEKVNRQFFPP